MKIVTVIPLAKGVFKENLTYFTAKEIKNGSVVSVSLRKKNILGLVVASEDVNAAKMDVKEMDFNLKKIIEVKENSIFLDEYIQAAYAVSAYFAGKINDCLTSLMPSIFREEYDKLSAIENEVKPLTHNLQNIKSEKVLFQASFPDRISYYKTMIRGSFAEKKSVFIVLPTEYDINNFEESLGKGIENFTFVMHGGIAKKKILENYEKIVSSTHPILIIATTPFLSIPRHDIGIIILENESSNIYKMISRPYMDLRTFAEIYASKLKAKFILADTLLRFETIERKEKDHFGEIGPLSFRTNFEGNSDDMVEILGPGPTARMEKKFKVLKNESVEKIQKTLDKKKNVFIFSLRKGLATYTICRDCNNTVSCEKCQAPVVLYLSRDGTKRIFSCNRCKRAISPETKCANCGSWNLMPLGIGTDTVFEETKKNFPNTKIFKLDKESATSAKEARKIVREFENTPSSILIGTEMAFFYLKELVPLSIVASFDSLWSIPNFKMGEKIIHILLSIISKTEKKIIIQTKNPEDPAILAIKSENLLAFVRSELADRKALEYPPFKRFIKITHIGEKDEAQETKQTLAKMFEEYKPDIFSGFVANLRGKYVTNMLIKMDIEKWSLPELSLGSSIDQNLLTKLQSLPFSFTANVDPEDLL